MNNFYLMLYDNVAAFISQSGQKANEIFYNNPDLYKELVRLANYRRCWNAYENSGMVRKDTKASVTVKVNIAKAFIDRSVDFLIGNMFTVYSPDKFNKLMAPVIKFINERAGVEALALEIVTNGSICGDSFVKAIWDDEIRSVRFQLLDSEKCFVKYRKTSKNRSELEYAIVVWFGEEVIDGRATPVLFKEKWTKDRYEKAIEWVDRKDVNDTSTWSSVMGWFNLYQNRPVGPDDYKTKIVEERDNDLGFIPVIHFRNQLVPLSDYGRSDIVDTIDLGKSLNEISTQYLDSTDYHGSPTILIYGAKVGNLKRGANKIWSGLPKDSKVDVLKYDSDFPAMKTLMDMLMDYAYLVTGIPEASSGLFQNISNTTGVALQVQYLPLIGLTKRKRITYGAGFVQLYEYGLKILDKQRGMGLQGRVDLFVGMQDDYAEAKLDELMGIAQTTPDVSDDITSAMDKLVSDVTLELGSRDFWRVEMRWADYLPKDSTLDLNEISMELDLGIESKRGAMKRRGIEDVDAKMIEIKGEKEEDAALFSAPTQQDMVDYSANGDGISADQQDKAATQYGEEKAEEQASPEVSGSVLKNG